MMVTNVSRMKMFVACFLTIVAVSQVAAMPPYSSQKKLANNAHSAMIGESRIPRDAGMEDTDTNVTKSFTENSATNVTKLVKETVATNVTKQIKSKKSIKVNATKSTTPADTIEVLMDKIEVNQTKGSHSGKIVQADGNNSDILKKNDKKQTETSSTKASTVQVSTVKQNAVTFINKTINTTQKPGQKNVDIISSTSKKPDKKLSEIKQKQTVTTTTTKIVKKLVEANPHKSWIPACKLGDCRNFVIPTTPRVIITTIRTAAPTTVLQRTFNVVTTTKPSITTTPKSNIPITSKSSTITSNNLKSSFSSTPYKSSVTVTSYKVPSTIDWTNPNLYSIDWDNVNLEPTLPTPSTEMSTTTTESFLFSPSGPGMGAEVNFGLMVIPKFMRNAFTIKTNIDEIE